MEWLQALQGTLAVALVVTTGLLGLQQGTVRTLRSSNSDIRTERDDMKFSRDEAKAEAATYRAASEAKVAELQASVDVLSSTVTGEAHLVALAQQLDEHHDALMKFSAETLSVLTAIQQALTHRDSS